MNLEEFRTFQDAVAEGKNFGTAEVFMVFFNEILEIFTNLAIDKDEYPFCA